MTVKRVVIAGGGVGGMTVALALLQRGIDVDVYEQASELREVGAGVQISPNGSRVLHQLGALEDLQALSCPAAGKEIRNWKTGEVFPTLSFDKQRGEPSTAPYMLVYRPHLLAVLAERVQSLKADAVHLRAKCSGVMQGASSSTLMLDNGEVVEGDVLIGADGVHSAVRGAVYGDGDPDFAGLTVWRSLIPMEDVPAHLQRPVGTNWIGPTGHVVHYPLNDRFMNFGATSETPAWTSGGWRVDSSAEECAAAFRGWHPDLLELIERAPTLSKWAMLLRKPLKQWSRGRVTLLGDACHPTLPFLAQGANMAMEDGLVLARCLNEIPDPVRSLQKYEQLRMQRTYRLVSEASAFRARFHNSALAKSDLADEYIRREWGSANIRARYDWIFDYDAAKLPVA